MIERPENAVEIYWTPIDPTDVDFIPGHLTRVVREADHLHLSFAGRDSRSGDEYQGVLTLGLRASSQTAGGAQTYRELGGKWEPVPFSVVGQFQDDGFTTFSGIWTEGGTRFQIDVLGLPAQSNPRPKSAGSRTSRRSGRRVK